MKTVTAHYWLLDESNGLEDVAEGCGDEVDHGDEGCCAGVAAGPRSGRLEEGVEALEAGVGVGRGPALDGPQMLLEGLQGLAEGLEDAPQPLIGDLHNPRRRQNRISRTSVIAACSMRSVKRPPALAQGHLDPLDAVGRPAFHGAASPRTKASLASIPPQPTANCRRGGSEITRPKTQAIPFDSSRSQDRYRAPGPSGTSLQNA